MVYRKLGLTGILVSEIGIGCEGFSGRDEAFTQELMDAAIDGGVNCMDLYSPDPDMHGRIGRALRGRRDKFIIQGHLCTAWKDGQYKCVRNIDEVRPAFETLLSGLGTDYIDVGMIHYVDSAKTWREISGGEVMRYAQELKAAGKIRHIGLSSHNPAVALEAVESGQIEVLMFSVNPCYDLLPSDEDAISMYSDKSFEKELLNMDPEREALYELCQRKGIGMTIMKAFAGGDLLGDDSPAGMALTVNQCIHYALTRPASATVFAGAKSVEQLKESLAYEDAADTDRDYAAAFARFPKISWKGHCMYCGHCAPCPSGIDVALVTKFMKLAKAQGAVPETVREHYSALEHTAAECTQCGGCEQRCPFGVDVRENMRLASEIFGGK